MGISHSISHCRKSVINTTKRSHSCKSGRHRSVANAELWSSTLARCCRHQTLRFLAALGLSWISGKTGKMFGVQSARIFQIHYDHVSAECLRHAPMPDPMTGRWKRSRSCRKFLHDQPRTRSMRKITFYKLQKSERQVPQLRLLGRT